MERQQARRTMLHPRVRAVRCRRGERGQAMIEYSIVNWLLLVALVLGATVRMIPGPGGQQQNVIELFLNAYNTYYDSFFYVLNLPLP